MATAKKLPSGQYRVLVYVGKGPDGKRQYKSFTAKTAAEAEFQASAFRTGRAKEAKANPLEQVTLQQAVERYVEARSAVLSPATAREYLRISKKAMPGLMALPLLSITQEEIQKTINLEALTHSPKTVRNYHGLLSTVLEAYRPEFVLHTKLPQKIKVQYINPDDADVQKLMAAAKGQRIEAAIMLSSCESLRRSEIAALKRSDIDPNNNILHVRRAIVLDENGKWVEKTTKTYESERDIALSASTIQYLARLPDYGEYLIGLTPDSITHAFWELRQKVGVGFRFHDLRAYNISVMHALGIPDEYIIKRSGHATNHIMQRVYRRAMQSKVNEVALKVNTHFDTLIDESYPMQHEMQHAEATIE